MWQYESGSHSSEQRPTFGSNTLYFRSGSGASVSTCHVIMQFSSQWVIGRNLTRFSNLVHVYGHCILLLLTKGHRECISMVDYDRHSYLPVSSVVMRKKKHPVKSHLDGIKTSSPDDPIHPWREVLRIIDRVHNATCGHFTFSDMRTLLQQSSLWSPEAPDHLPHSVE